MQLARKKTFFILIVILAFGLGGVMIGCQLLTTKPKTMDRFIYQLQKVSPKTLYDSSFDLAVIDWEDCPCTKENLNYLHQQNKLIVSYLSIGEAESYRPYWKKWWKVDPPKFLEEENPDWEENYKVYYWDPKWQAIIFDRLDKIIELGYDGIYLDIVDAYYYFEQKGEAKAKQAMIDFVIAISEFAKNRNPNFLIIPQNAVELVSDPAYMAAIDGLGKEDTWYIGDDVKEAEGTNWELKFLRKTIQAGKFVLAIDYPVEKKKRCDFIRKAEGEGFLSFVGNRALDRVVEVDC